MTNRNRIPSEEMRESANLRQRWLAWLGRTHTRKADALTAIGWATRRPKWASDGNIPWGWRLRIQRQIGEVVDGRRSA